MSKARKGAGAAEVLERSPSHLLHRAVQLALDAYAEAVGPGGPTQRQFAVLAAVAAREGVAQSELVRLTGIDRSTLAELVARMIGKGLLVRQRSSVDARANAVSLTEDGRAALAATLPAADAADARLLEHLGKGKRDGFVAALRQLARAADKAALKEERTVEPAAAAAPIADTPPETAKPAKTDKLDKAKKQKKKAKLKAAPEKAERRKAALVAV